MVSRFDWLQHRNGDFPLPFVRREGVRGWVRQSGAGPSGAAAVLLPPGKVKGPAVAAYPPNYLAAP
ncbi:hypothetical protein [Sporomusa carbonis]|uniref:hypothetical protein n=1 Tax=Sporomusa carbonis TaxID=3076075 RepID=UPI003C7DD00A